MPFLQPICSGSLKGKTSDDSQISVEELESSISVKISKEAVMSINSPESLFTPVNGKVETKVHIAGLPERADTIKPVSSLPPNAPHPSSVVLAVFTPTCVRSTLASTAASGHGI